MERTALSAFAQGRQNDGSYGGDDNGDYMDENGGANGMDNEKHHEDGDRNGQGKVVNDT